MTTGRFTNTYWLLVPPTAKDDQVPAELWVSLHGVVGNPENGMAVLVNQARERGVFLAAPTGAQPVETPAGQPQNYIWDMDRQPDAIAALVAEIRAAHPQIAADRVMLIGFSRGGLGKFWPCLIAIRDTDPKNPNPWNVPRAYRIPPDLIRAGANMIAIRQFVPDKEGDINGRPDRLYL